MYRLHLCLACLAFTCTTNLFANETTDRPYGLDHRQPWTTSRVTGRPEPPLPFRARRVFPNLAFDRPTVLTSAPGTRRLFVAEHAGKIFSIPNDQDCDEADLLIDVADLVKQMNDSSPASERVRLVAVYGMTFHPQFAENGFCYVCYVVSYTDRSRGQHPAGTRVVRLKVNGSEPPVCDPASEQTVIAWLQGGHNGGCLKFGPDGFLYISAGDGGFAFPPDGRNSGQDVSNLLSSVFRIDVDHPDADHPEGDRPYSIPPDNPFVSLPDARGEIWAYGMRNPWKMSFDAETGDLWVGDVGWELWELVYRVRPGDNFGWSLVEGRQPVHVERRRGPTPIVPPAVEIPHTDGASVTGGFVYRGKKFPELVGHYLFGDWETRRIWAVDTSIRAAPVPDEARREVVEPTVRIVGFAEDNDRELLLLDYDDGTIHELERNKVDPAQHPFPRKLSETGLFADVSVHEIEDAVIGFSINSPLWADHAQGERFLALPHDSSIKLHAEKTRVPGSMFSRRMDFPKDAVLMKTLSLEMVHGDPSSSRRIETQLLHYDGRDWRGYSYRWNDDQTDAVLVARSGLSTTLTVTDENAPGGKRRQAWRFPSRMECIRCHNPWAEHSLAFNVPQINRVHDYGRVEDNQIRTLRHVGVLENVIKQPDPEDPYAPIAPHLPADELPKLANPFDKSADMDARGRSYIQANCAHCHRNGGGGAAHVHIPFDVPLVETKALGLRPTQGAFGIRDAEIISPGDPYRSVLYYRMAKTGSGHMPRLGANLIDERGVSLIHDWIRQIPPRLETEAKIERLNALDEKTVLAAEAESAKRTRWRLARRQAEQQGREKPNDDDFRAAEKQAAEQAAARVEQRRKSRPQLAGELLSTPADAMLLARAVREDRLTDSIQALAVRAAMASSLPTVRDLFESFIPDDQRAVRLGESVRPEQILRLTGDVDRGRRMFHESTTIQCRNCHRINGKGKELGPDLSKIGKKLDRAKILESILEPSRNIDPKYISWLIEMSSGKLVTGLLVEKTDEKVILRDAQSKQIELATEEIDGMFPQRKSLMPDLLFRDMTAEQVADLLAYLSSLR